MLGAIHELGNPKIYNPNCKQCAHQTEADAIELGAGS